MKVISHAVFAEACWFGASSMLDIRYGEASIVAVALCSVLPDADYPKSWAGYMLGGISEELNAKFGHRSFLHSLLALALFGAALYPLFFAGYQAIWSACLVGYGSHLFADMMTLGGVQLFFPSRAWAIFPGRDEYRIRSGGRSERVFFALALAAALLLYPLSQHGLGSLIYKVGEGATEYASVTRVIDGDTIEADIQGRKETVRLLGVDTPETVHPDKGVQCYGPEASAYTKQHLEGQNVQLQLPTIGDSKDKYGRMLAYISLGGEDYNLSLLKGGYARTTTFNHERKREYEDAEQGAKDKRVGLWGAACAA